MEIKTNEELITMTVSDFKELIAEEVRRNISNVKVTSPKSVFNDLIIRDNNIHVINQKSEIVKKWSNDCTPNKRGRHLGEYAVYTKNFYNTSGYGKTHKVGATQVHELTRSLALSVLGHTINNDLNPDEFGHVQEYYSEFKELWLQLYKERIEQLEGK